MLALASTFAANSKCVVASSSLLAWKKREQNRVRFSSDSKGTHASVNHMLINKHTCSATLCSKNEASLLNARSTCSWNVTVYKKTTYLRMHMEDVTLSRKNWMASRVFLISGSFPAHGQARVSVSQIITNHVITKHARKKKKKGAPSTQFVHIHDRWWRLLGTFQVRLAGHQAHFNEFVFAIQVLHNR